MEHYTDLNWQKALVKSRTKKTNPSDKMKVLSSTEGTSKFRIHSWYNFWEKASK